MPKLKNQFPELCRDRNQAISWYKGKRIHHGVWDSPEAEKDYRKHIAKLAENPTLPLRDNETGDTLVSELAAGFLRYVEPRLDKTEFQHYYPTKPKIVIRLGTIVLPRNTRKNTELSCFFRDDSVSSVANYQQYKVWSGSSMKVDV